MTPTRSLKKLRILFLSLLILLLAGTVVFAAPSWSQALDDADEATAEEATAEEAIADEAAPDEAVVEEAVPDEAVVEEAAPQATSYGLWVAGVEISSDNNWDITSAINSAAGSTVADGWAVYDPARQTLYLGNFSTTSSGWTGWTGKIPGIGDATCAIYCTHDLTIVVLDSPEIHLSAPSYLDGYSRFGAYVNGNLTIKATDYYDDIAFIVGSVDSGLSDCGTYGLYANTILFDGIYVDAIVGDPSPGFPSYGVYAVNSLKMGFDAYYYGYCSQRALNRKPTFTSDAYKPFVYAGDPWVKQNISTYAFADEELSIGVEPSLQRLAGSDRYATGAAITDVHSVYGAYWADTVILATGKDYPDALCASALAGYYDAPILMVEPNRLPASTAQALKNLHPDRIGIVGGTGAVSNSVVQAACNITGVPYNDSYVKRFSGANRYETGLSIYRDGGLAGNDTCIIATGGNFADALSISPYAYATYTPIFLADSKTHKLNSQLEAALSGEGFSKVIIVGGTGVVSDEVADQLGVSPSNVVRLAGSNRYSTSVAIAKWEMGDFDPSDYAFGPDYSMGPGAISVATGTGFADALAGGALCGSNYSPLLLVGSSASSNAEAVSLLGEYRYGYRRGYVFGGTGAVSAAVKAQLDKALEFDEMDGSSLPEEGQVGGHFGKR